MLNQKSFAYYLTGLILSIIFTVISFAIVHYHSMSTGAIYTWIVIFMVLQLLTQAVCFLRLNTATEEGKLDMVSLIFTIIVIAILVLGSLWIMENLNFYMVH